MAVFDEVEGILPPYGTQFRVWDCKGDHLRQHDLVPEVGMATTYAIMLTAPHGSPARFLWVQDNRITNLMAHQPIQKSSVFDDRGRYLGQGGEPLDVDDLSKDAGSVSLLEMMRETAEVQEAKVKSAVPVEARANREVTCRTHKLWLRSEFEAEIRLPLDLSREEAKRLSTFIAALPLRS